MGGWNKQGVKIFLQFQKVGGGDNNITYRGNPNNPGGNRRGDYLNRSCLVKIG